MEAHLLKSTVNWDEEGVTSSGDVWRQIGQIEKPCYVRKPARKGLVNFEALWRTNHQTDQPMWGYF